MSAQTFRLARGGRIDRSKQINFTFNGRAYQGYAGDTLASALLANGVRLIGRSFKYHRPRGIVSAGPEEPNALVRIGSGGRALPNLPATMVELYEGLEAASINCWPSVDFDCGAVNNLISRVLPAGFYYKTFMWPRGAWMWYKNLFAARQGWGARRMRPIQTVTKSVSTIATCSSLAAVPPALLRRLQPATRAHASSSLKSETRSADNSFTAAAWLTVLQRAHGGALLARNSMKCPKCAC